MRAHQSMLPLRHSNRYPATRMAKAARTSRSRHLNQRSTHQARTTDWQHTRETRMARQTETLKVHQLRVGKPVLLERRCLPAPP